MDKEANYIELNQCFLDEGYSIESLLAKIQNNNLKLTEFREKLVQHQQDLSQTSLELFNNNYDRFYKLSYMIACLAEPIQHLTEPVQGFRDQLGELCQGHDQYLSQINQKIDSLEETNRNKELAKRLIVLIKRRDRIEKQLGNIDWSLRPVDRGSRSAQVTAGQDDANSVHYRIKFDLLERINIEFFHLMSEVRAIQPTHDELIPIKKSLEANLDERQCQLDNWFESTFLEAIELQDKQLLDLILKTYQLKEATHKLDAVWRAKVVKPYLKLILTEQHLFDGISRAYKLLDQFVSGQLELINAEFVIRSFWSEIVESLEALEKLYSLNELDTFQHRYIETESFLRKQGEYHLSGLVKLGISERDAKTNTQRVLSRFNLKGYFNHRLSQVASSVESSLTQQPLSEIPPLSASSSPNSHDSVLAKFKLKICMHIYALIVKCWSPDIYIDALDLYFSQLACRVLNRFADWLGKLRLSDFRITGAAAPENNRQTNFLAKQDAIMRLLIEDCERLTERIDDFLSSLTNADPNLKSIRRELIQDSYNTLGAGLNNVRSLQRLIER